MKKKTKETIWIGIGLIALTIILHYAHYLIFKDLHHTLIFFVADIAFIPMEVFFTTLILDKMLEKKEKNHTKEKLNMIIGVFYTEVGTMLLSKFASADNNTEDLKKSAIVNRDWNRDSFKTLRGCLDDHEYKIDMNKIDLSRLIEILDVEKEFLINLITNPVIHEHEEFTEMLMSIMHIREELKSRCCKSLEPYEVEHLSSDISEAYKYLTLEWARYMKYLQGNYPKLFTKAMINNPFDGRTLKEKDNIYLKL